MSNTPANCLKFIETQIASGKTVQVTTATRVTRISPSTAKKWAASGLTLFKLAQDGALLMTEGKRFVRLSTPSQMLVTVSSY